MHLKIISCVRNKLCCQLRSSVMADDVLTCWVFSDGQIINCSCCAQWLTVYRYIHTMLHH